MEKQKCTVLVGSCDAYSDIWEPFFNLLERFWKDRPYDVVLSTETLTFETNDKSIKTINPESSKSSWTARIADALKKIDTKYVIFILDDFFLLDNVQTKKIEKCITWMNKNPDIATMTFWPTANDTTETGYKGFGQRPDNAKYKVAAILGLWNKETLLKYVDGYDESAWEFEVNATNRANSLYPEDKFYIMQPEEDFIFPYDFTKVGLFAGQWFSDTKNVFSTLGVKIDFNKRGFYDEALRGLSQSIISAFQMDSAVIPYYNLKHPVGRIPYFVSEKVTQTGTFTQKYIVDGAHSIVRWEPASLWGFSLTNFVVKVIYLDGTEEEIDNNLLFGNFKKINEELVFNSPTPHVYIPTKIKKNIMCIKINGETKMPLTKTILQETFNYVTKPKYQEHEILYSKLWLEFLLIPEKTSHLCINSKIKFKINGKYDEKNMMKSKKVIKKGFFTENYSIPKNATEIIWIPSTSAGFAVKNLNIKFEYIDGQRFKGKILKSNFIIMNKYALFLDTTNVFIQVPNNYTKKVCISGEFVSPIPSDILYKVHCENYKPVYSEPKIIQFIRKKDKLYLEKYSSKSILRKIYRILSVPIKLASKLINLFFKIIHIGGSSKL